jgi:hypothetical protein
METSVRSGDLEVVRRRREELRETLGALEEALASPATSRAGLWGERVRAAVRALLEEFAQHVVVTEGPEGLHQAILAGDLRLANAVEALTADHTSIASGIAELLGTTQPPVAPERVEDIRIRGTKLIAQIARHRQRGADLVHEAFDTDLGGGD